jgi:hypothetical protein
MNEYGVPLHACFGHRHDGHYWAWIRHRILRGDYGERLRVIALSRGA